eukprot:gene13776-13897_t
MSIAVIVTVREFNNIPTFLPDVDTTVFNAFRLITFVMALLMAYRVNRTYDRWSAGQWIQDSAVKAEIGRWCKIWHYSILQVCRGDPTISPSAAAWMTERELQEYQASRKGRNLVVICLRRLIHRADAHVVERREMEKALRTGINASGTCIRLKFQCMPYSITLITTGFLQIFLMFLPLAIITVTEPVHTGDHPAFGLIIHFCICVLMLGVDEVANQLEQPFPHIPMVDIVDTTVRDIDRPDVVHSKTRPQEWCALQSEWRFLHATLFYLGPPSHILWHIKYPLLLNMAIAVLITADQVRQYYKQASILPELADHIVFNSFRLTTFVMALLMAFRVNRTYDRWWTGRQSFAGVGNAGLTLSMQAMQWVPDPAIRAEIRRWSKIWHYTTLQLCRGDKLLDPAAAALMTDEELQEYHSSRKGRNLVIINLRRLIYLSDIRAIERHQMEAVVQAGVAAQGTCSRLKFQSMPYSLTLICTGFLQIFLMFLPFAVISVSTIMPNMGDHPAFGLLIYFFTCVLMLGVDEVANQLEQPFPHMPMTDMVETTVRDIDRLPLECSTWERLQDAALENQRARLNNTSKTGAADAMRVQGSACADDKSSNEISDATDVEVEAYWQSPANQQTIGDVVVPMGPA